VLDQWGEEFRFEKTRGRGKQSLRLTLNCLDPARLLAQRQKQLHASIAFSATLSPTHWLRPGLGYGESAVCRQLDSPFAPEQLAVSLECSIDTRYRQRAATLAPLAARIARWLKDQPGNCIVYFPSYRYLRDCLALLGSDELTAAGRTTWIQGACADPAERESLLPLLQSRRDVAAFCILGGIFGEGVDLPGEALSSVVIVGVGLPQVNRQSEQLREYFQQSYDRGFEFAYLYPGLQKVNQAMGRVIRGADDRGRALLIDGRYAHPEYRQLLAPWWHYVE
jgi:DNA excision repair protein ERCC-2